MKMSNDLEFLLNVEWKEKNSNYLTELQRFFDYVENINDDELKNTIVFQMLKIDSLLTNLALERFEECYNKGKKAK